MWNYSQMPQHPNGSIQMYPSMIPYPQQPHDQSHNSVKNEDFQEIYNYIKKKQKKKYIDKIDKLKKQLKQANATIAQSAARPEQRTVKMQTKNPIAYINRGLNPIEPPKEDQEISAQPSFRQESLEKAVSEKLDEIERRAQEHSKKK
jgi:hypothetical protein